MILDYWSRKSARRAEIRKKLPERGKLLKDLRADGSMVSLWVAAVFMVLAAAILQLRESVVQYRPGQWASHDVVARVDFAFHDDAKLSEAKRRAHESASRVYRSNGDTWSPIEKFLLDLPDKVADLTLDQLPPEIKDTKILDKASLAKLQERQGQPQRTQYNTYVKEYIESVRQLQLVIIPERERTEDREKRITLQDRNSDIPAEGTLSPSMTEQLQSRLEKLTGNLGILQGPLVAFTIQRLTPTHVLDEAATADAKNRAEERIASVEGDVHYGANSKLIKAGEISYGDYLLLRAENDAYLKTLGDRLQLARLGLIGAVLVLSVILSAYVVRYQPRVVRNNARAIGIAALLLSMLLLAQLAGLSSSPTYVFGLAPTILVAMIIAIAYDQRFAAMAGCVHAMLVTLALDRDLGFLLILVTGVVTCSFLLDDLRTRSKLIEVGGLTSVAMCLATAAVGLLNFDPVPYIVRNCLYAAAAGFGVGFVVLGILPFIEKAFRITTSMTLLELADMSHPLLRRLAMEAPGTYNHSLQVATLSEEAAEAIGANSLQCRVASYYHDVGKINKAEYFIENQHDGQNRHMHLTPSVSILIIIGHVKDGLELAKEYQLPTSLFPFIQQHHGTTLVELFYHRACTEQDDPTSPAPSESQYRYPGPKPKSKEIAIVMLSDAVESACRAMTEPTASRVETLVHKIAMQRLLDGQFDECELTLRDVERIEKSLAKTLLGIYHGRIAYPSTSEATASALAAFETPASRTA